jgi:hypothetical protein
MLSKLDRSEAQMFCVPFNNLTILTGLAVLLMESALGFNVRKTAAPG